jgi:hypothetical protein
VLRKVALLSDIKIDGDWKSSVGVRRRMAGSASMPTRYVGSSAECTGEVRCQGDEEGR